MIDNATVLDKPQISIVIDDMNWGYKMCSVLLPNSHVFVSAHIISVEIYSWAFVEQALIASKLFIIAVLDLEFCWFKFPYILAQIVIDCIFEVVVVREVLFGMGKDEFSYCLKAAYERQLRNCRAK